MSKTAELLTALGFNVDDVEKDDFVIEDAILDYQNTLKDKLKAELAPSIKESLKNETYQGNLQTIRRHFERENIFTRAELEGKEIKDILKMLAGKTSSGESEELKALKLRITDLHADIDAKDAALAQKEADILAATEQSAKFVRNYKKETLVNGFLNNPDKIKFDDDKKAGMYKESIIRHLDKYTIDPDTGAIMNTDGTPAMSLDGKTRLKTYSDAALDYAAANNCILKLDPRNTSMSAQVPAQLITQGAPVADTIDLSGLNRLKELKSSI